MYQNQPLKIYNGIEIFFSKQYYVSRMGVLENLFNYQHPVHH